jgi:hypothetical protein
MTGDENKRGAWEAWRLRRLSRTEAHPMPFLGVDPSFLCECSVKGASR